MLTDILIQITLATPVLALFLNPIEGIKTLKTRLYPMPLEVNHEISKALVFAARERFMVLVEGTAEAAATMQAAGMFAVAEAINNLTQVLRTALSLIREEIEADKQRSEQEVAR